MEDITGLTINTYNEIAEQYTQDFFNNEEDKKFVNEFVKYLNGNKILDMGCGCGNLTKEFIKDGYDTVGIDLSKKMIEIARKKVPNTRFEIQDIRKTNFEDETFDGLFVSRSLIHIKSEEIQKTLQEFYRILKNNGVVGIIVRVTEEPFEQIEKEVYNPNLDIFFKYFSEKELQEELIKAKFFIEYSNIENVKDLDTGEIVKRLFIIAKK